MSQKAERGGRDFDVREGESTDCRIPIRIHSKPNRNQFKKYVAELIRVAEKIRQLHMCAIVLNRKSESQQMDEFQRSYCHKMLDKIEKRPVAQFFKEPLTADSEYMSGYVEVPQRPMDLGTIRKKLNSGAYSTISEWGADVRQIWWNAQSIYPKESPIHIIAHELSDWFERKWSEYPRTRQEQWMKKVTKLGRLVKWLNERMPVKKDLIPQPEELK
jgi:hypothetical protein